MLIFPPLSKGRMTYVVRGEQFPLGATLQQHSLEPQDLENGLPRLGCELVGLELGKIIALDRVGEETVKFVKNRYPSL